MFPRKFFLFQSINVSSLKITSTVLLVLFSATTIAWSAPTPPILGNPFSSTSLIQDIEIPQRWGSVVERYRASSSSPTVIHIQDAHAQIEAQLHTKEILTYLKRQYGLDALFLEGGFKKLDPKQIQFFEDPLQNKTFAELLLRDGVLSGAELFLFEELVDRTERVTPGYGVEATGAYRENLLTYRRVTEQVENSEVVLQNLKQNLQVLGSRFFNKDLHAFFKKWIFFQETQHDLPGYLLELKAAAKKHLSLDLNDFRSQLDWPQLIRFIKVQRLQSSIDFNQVEQDRKKFSKWLRANNLKRFQEPLDPGTGHLDRAVWENFFDLRDYVEKLHHVASEKGFRFENYPALSRFWGLRILESEMKVETFQQEIEKLSEQVFVALARNKQEKRIVRLYEHYLLLSKLLRLELTPEDYKQVQDKENDLRPSFFFAQVSHFSKDVSLPIQKTMIDPIYEEALTFYRGVQKRDQIMFENMVTRMKGENQKIVVLITGGFHTPGIAKLLREQKLSYFQIIPRMSEISTSLNDQDILMLRKSSNALRSTIKGILPLSARSEIRKADPATLPFFDQVFEAKHAVANRLRSETRPVPVFARPDSRKAVYIQMLVDSGGLDRLEAVQIADTHEQRAGRRLSGNEWMGLMRDLTSVIRAYDAARRSETRVDPESKTEELSQEAVDRMSFQRFYEQAFILIRDNAAALLNSNDVEDKKAGKMLRDAHTILQTLKIFQVRANTDDVVGFDADISKRKIWIRGHEAYSDEETAAIETAKALVRNALAFREFDTHLELRQLSIDGKRKIVRSVMLQGDLAISKTRDAKAEDDAKPFQLALRVQADEAFVADVLHWLDPEGAFFSAIKVRQREADIEGQEKYEEELRDGIRLPPLTRELKVFLMLMRDDFEKRYKGQLSKLSDSWVDFALELNEAFRKEAEKEDPRENPLGDFLPSVINVYGAIFKTAKGLTRQPNNVRLDPPTVITEIEEVVVAALTKYTLSRHWAGEDIFVIQRNLAKAIRSIDMPLQIYGYLRAHDLLSNIAEGLLHADISTSAAEEMITQQMGVKNMTAVALGVNTALAHLEQAGATGNVLKLTQQSAASIEGHLGVKVTPVALIGRADSPAQQAEAISDGKSGKELEEAAQQATGKAEEDRVLWVDNYQPNFLGDRGFNLRPDELSENMVRHLKGVHDIEGFEQGLPTDWTLNFDLVLEKRGDVPAEEDLDELGELMMLLLSLYRHEVKKTNSISRVAARLRLTENTTRPVQKAWEVFSNKRVGGFLSERGMRKEAGREELARKVARSDLKSFTIEEKQAIHFIVLFLHGYIERVKKQDLEEVKLANDHLAPRVLGAYVAALKKVAKDHDNPLFQQAAAELIVVTDQIERATKAEKDRKERLEREDALAKEAAEKTTEEDEFDDDVTESEAEDRTPAPKPIATGAKDLLKTAAGMVSSLAGRSQEEEVTLEDSLGNYRKGQGFRDFIRRVQRIGERVQLKVEGVNLEEGLSYIRILIAGRDDERAFKGAYRAIEIATHPDSNRDQSSAAAQLRQATKETYEIVIDGKNRDLVKIKEIVADLVEAVAQFKLPPKEERKTGATAAPLDLETLRTMVQETVQAALGSGAVGGSASLMTEQQGLALFTAIERLVDAIQADVDLSDLKQAFVKEEPKPDEPGVEIESAAERNRYSPANVAGATIQQSFDEGDAISVQLNEFSVFEFAFETDESRYVRLHYPDEVIDVHSDSKIGHGKNGGEIEIVETQKASELYAFQEVGRLMQLLFGGGDQKLTYVYIPNASDEVDRETVIFPGGEVYPVILKESEEQQGIHVNPLQPKTLDYLRQIDAIKIDSLSEGSQPRSEIRFQKTPSHDSDQSLLDVLRNNEIFTTDDPRYQSARVVSEKVTQKVWREQLLATVAAKALLHLFLSPEVQAAEPGVAKEKFVSYLSLAIEEARGGRGAQAEVEIQDNRFIIYGPQTSLIEPSTVLLLDLDAAQRTAWIRGTPSQMEAYEKAITVANEVLEGKGLEPIVVQKDTVELKQSIRDAESKGFVGLGRYLFFQDESLLRKQVKDLSLIERREVIHEVHSKLNQLFNELMAEEHVRLSA